MKSLLRDIVINSFALWATSQLITGLRIQGGFDIVLFGGIALTLMNLLVKPVLSILTLPLTLLTMGLFSWLLNVVLIYLLTVLVPQISITTYQFPGMSSNGISLPSFTFSSFQTAILVAFTVSLIANFVFWLCKR